MKKSMITFLLSISVLFSVAQQQLTRNDFYGTWELSSVNSVVLHELKNDKGNPFMPTTYFIFKKKKLYSFYREAVTTKGTFNLTFSSMGINTLLLTDNKGDNHQFLITYEKKDGEQFLMLTDNKKRVGNAAEAKNVTGFIKIRDRDLKDFQKKVEQEKKLLIKEQNK